MERMVRMPGKYHDFQALLFLNEHLEKADTICTLLSLGYRSLNELSLASSQGQVEFGWFTQIRAGGFRMLRTLTAAEQAWSQWSRGLHLISFILKRNYILEANWIQIHLQVEHTIWVRPVKSNGQLHWRENSTETRWNVQREETAQWSRLSWSQCRHEECFSIRSFPGEIRVAEATAVWFLIFASCKVGLSVFF